MSYAESKDYWARSALQKRNWHVAQAEMPFLVQLQILFNRQQAWDACKRQILGSRPAVQWCAWMSQIMIENCNILILSIASCPVGKTSENLRTQQLARHHHAWDKNLFMIYIINMIIHYFCRQRAGWSFGKKNYRDCRDMCSSQTHSAGVGLAWDVVDMVCTS